MTQVNDAIGAAQLQSSGDIGSGVGVALIDSGVVPVAGLTGPDKVVNGPDLSFESQQGATAYLDSYGHGTHMAGIIGGSDGAGGTFQGVAPGARVISLKVASHDGAADDHARLSGADDTRDARVGKKGPLGCRSLLGGCRRCPGRGAPAPQSP